jgi:hypothetical protein
MNQDPERFHDAYAPVHILPLLPGRCAEVLTDSGGQLLRCHRADHGGEGEHHINDRAWTGRQTAGTIRQRPGVPCGPDCIYPEEAEVRGSKTAANHQRATTARPGT